MEAVDLPEALHRILEDVQAASVSETVALSDANGRVLATALEAPVSLPPFDSSAMDGYAFRAPTETTAAGQVFRIVGESLAGHPYSGGLTSGECIRITTGAAVPECADTVVIQENCECFDTRLRLLEPVDKGSNIRVAGHDVQKGEPIGRQGQRLTPFDIGWFAACGLTDISVFQRPRVAIFSTGDELVPPGGALRGGQIFDANRLALAALLEHAPVTVTDLGILPDEPAAIEQALAGAAGTHELLLTSGGVSVGDADYVKEIVDRLGRIELWRLNLKPGKPLAFGRIDQALFLGLPGNPVSTIVTFLLVAKPVLLALAGAPFQPPAMLGARLLDDVRHNSGREEFQRGCFERRGEEVVVRINGDQSSNRLATFSGANCLIRVPKDAGDLSSGSTVDILPFFGLTS